MSAEVKCKKCGNVSQKGNAHCVFCGEELPTETGSLFDRTENSSYIGRNADNNGYLTVEQGKNEQEWKCQDMCSRAVLAFFCKFEFSMIKYSVLWAGMATFWLSCLIVI